MGGGRADSIQWRRPHYSNQATVEVGRTVTAIPDSFHQNGGHKSGPKSEPACSEFWLTFMILGVSEEAGRQTAKSRLALLKSCKEAVLGLVKGNEVETRGRTDGGGGGGGGEDGLRRRVCFSGRLAPLLRSPSSPSFSLSLSLRDSFRLI